MWFRSRILTDICKTRAEILIPTIKDVHTMNKTFHGAAGRVIGSKHLIGTDQRERILLDCGIFQGEGRAGDFLNRHFGFNHANYSKMLAYLSCQRKVGAKGIFLVHGDQPALAAWKSRLIDHGYKNVVIKEDKQKVEIE